MADKVVPLSDAISHLVEDGDTIALGGWVITRCVSAVVHELIRHRKRELTVCQGLSGFDTDLLVGAGAVRRLITGGGSLDAFGRLNRINDMFSSRKIEVEENSALSMATRFLAGSLGLPFLPSRTLLGSTILKDLEGDSHAAVEMNCPFTGEHLALLRALSPKTAIIHVQRADKDGNAQIFGPLWDTGPIVGASERLLLTTEELVDRSEITNAPERTTIPGFKVAAVSVIPYGAHPTSCYRWYDYDAEQLKAYAAASTSQDKFDRYLSDYVLSQDNFERYLGIVCPPSSRERLRARPERGY